MLYPISLVSTSVAWVTDKGTVAKERTRNQHYFEIEMPDHIIRTLRGYNKYSICTLVVYVFIIRISYQTVFFVFFLQNENY